MLLLLLESFDNFHTLAIAFFKGENLSVVSEMKTRVLDRVAREETLINNRQAERSRVMEALSFHSSYLPKACLFYMAQKEARYIMVIGTSCFSCLSKVCQSDGEITTMDDGSGPVPALA